MIRSFLMFNAIMICSFAAIAQAYLEGGPTYGTFSMKDMKRMQQEFTTGGVLPGKIVSSFPSWWGYQISFGYKTASGQRFGISGSGTSTGGRYMYSDYSGSQRYDQLLGNFGVSLLAEIPFSRKANRFKISGILRGGMINTKFQSLAVVTIGPAEVSRQDVQFKSASIFLQPGLTFRRELTGALSIAGELGYALDVSGKLADADGQPIVLSNHDQVRSDWSGLRVGLSVSLNLAKKNSSADPATQK